MSFDLEFLTAFWLSRVAYDTSLGGGGLRVPAGFSRASHGD